MDPDRVPPLPILQQHRPEDEQRHDGPGEQDAALHPGLQQKTLRRRAAGGGLRRPRTTHLPGESDTGLITRGRKQLCISVSLDQ